MLDGADYSEAEIALPTPTASHKSIASVTAEGGQAQALPFQGRERLTDVTDNTSHNGIEIALDSPETSSNTNGASVEAMSPPQTDAIDSKPTEYAHDSGKASIFALLGGGIMAIIATILALLI